MSKEKDKAVRSDDPDFRKQIMEQALNGIKPPTYVHLEPEHMSYWRIITDARAVWTDVDLVQAANLARTFYQIETEQKLLHEEGMVVLNAMGAPVTNPRHMVIEQLTKRAVTLQCKIQVHAAATIGEIENNKNKNKVKQQAVRAASMMHQDEDDLLAKPLVN